MDMFPIKVQGGGFAAIFALAMNMLLWFAGAFVIGLGLTLGWGLGS